MPLRWRPQSHFLNRQLPISLRHWLLDEGSLTQRLTRLSHGNFSVQLLDQQWQRPNHDEARLLGRPQSEWAIVREVILAGAGKPWVFARSVLPATSLTGNLRQLRYLKSRPLGQLLFNAPSMRRTPFEIAQIPAHSKYLHSSISREISSWGRRSRFEVYGRPILVSEVFLPGFIP